MKIHEDLSDGEDGMSKNFAIATCSLCHGSYTVRRVTMVRYCPSCKQEARRLRDTRKRLRSPIERMNGAQLIRTEADAVLIRESGMYMVSDPLGAGGFAKDIYFGRLEWIAMVKHFTFSPGSVLRGVSGTLYLIPDIARPTTEEADE